MACMRLWWGVFGGTGWPWLGGVSLSLTGMAGSSVIVIGPMRCAPKSGLRWLRYLVYQLVSTLSFCRLVSRPIFFAPVALVLGRVRNASRFTGSAPLATR